MKVYIKNMVCNRCIMVVKQVFENAGFRPVEVTMGEVELDKELSKDELSIINNKLSELGFEVLDNKGHKLIEKIKGLLISKVQSGDIEEHFSLKEFLSSKLVKEYTQVSRLFSEAEGITIEQFYILQKIEKVKEWLVYGELTLSEITWKLGYSSVAHLSSQFKKITGLNPSDLKKKGSPYRVSLDGVKQNSKTKR